MKGVVVGVCFSCAILASFLTLYLQLVLLVKGALSRQYPALGILGGWKQDNSVGARKLYLGGRERKTREVGVSKEER